MASPLVRSARKATSPLGLTAGRPTNCLKVPPSGAVSPMLATCLWVVGEVRWATINASAVSPWATSPRKAIHPEPAAAGQPAKLGPANSPPPGAGSPIAATTDLEAAPAGETLPSAARQATAQRARRSLP